MTRWPASTLTAEWNETDCAQRSPKGGVGTRRQPRRQPAQSREGESPRLRVRLPATAVAPLRVALSASYLAPLGCHTLKEKRPGKTKADFFREEQRALKPFQPGLFDELPES